MQMQGCVYISGLSVDHKRVRALMKYARVLLISTTAFVRADNLSRV